jgi:hypothetical protein
VRLSEPGLGWRAFGAAALVVVVIDTAAYLLDTLVPAIKLFAFAAPLFGGLIAGRSRVRPLVLGALAPLLGSSVVLAVVSAIDEALHHHPIEQAEAPTGLLIGFACYTAIVGAVGAKITS